MPVLPGIGAAAGLLAAMATTLVLSGTPGEADKNVSYSWTPTTTGASGSVTYSIGSGALPTGLSINSSTGAITGTPTVFENQTFTIHGVDSLGSFDLTVTIHVWDYLGYLVAAANYNMGAEYNLVPVTTSGAAIYADALRMIFQTTQAASRSRPVIYSQTGSVPDALVFSGPNFTHAGSAGNVTSDLPFATLKALSASTTYWIGIANESGNTDARADGTATPSRFKAHTFASADDNPIGSTSTFGSRICCALHIRLQ